MNYATQQALQHSLTLIQSGQLDKALKVLPETDDCDASRAEIAFIKGLVAQKREQLRDAMIHFETAISCRSEHWQALNHSGICCKKLHDFDAAFDFYVRALRVCPSAAGAEILRNVLILLAQHTDNELVRRIRDDYHALILQHPVLLKLNADIDRARQDWKKAIEGYLQALRLKPGYGFALHNLGNCYLNQGDSKNAITYLERALQVQPEHAENWESMGDVRVAEGNVSQAEQYYLEALKRDSGCVTAHASLNELYWQSEQQNKFGWSYEQVLHHEPDNQVVRYSYIDLLISAGQDGKAMAIVDDGLQRANDWQLWHFKAKLHGRQGDNEASLKAFKCGISDKVDLSFLQDKAQMELKSGYLSDASLTLDSASQRAPDDQLTIALWGTLWRQLGDSRYQWLNDYGRFVQAYQLPVPKGYDCLENFLLKLKSELLSLYRFSRAPLKQTLVNGAQLPGRLFAQRNPVVQELVEGIRQIVEQYIASLPDDNNHPLLARKSNQFWFSGSWSVKLVPNGYHVAHVHPEGWISSSCYIHLPDSMGQDNSDQQGAIQFGASPLSLATSDEPELTVVPKPGMVVLFPSYMWHRTVPFHSEDADAFRLTTPFDVSVARRS